VGSLAFLIEEERTMITGHISFQGEPPYAIGLVQTAKARAVGDSIEIVLRVTREGRPDPEPAIVQMALSAADILLDTLANAVLEARNA
jgi:hypothetical protein